MPNNLYYKSYDDKYILKKSSINIDINDIFVFAIRNIENIMIPESVKIIDSYSFDECNRLQKVEIPINSKLERIEKYSFSHSSINSIMISSSVINISENSFL